MTATLEALEAILAAEAALDQWDAPPSLGLLARRGDDFRLEPFELSEEFWGLSDPVSLVAIIAVAINHPDRPAWAEVPVRLEEGYQLAGVALFTESWGLNLTGMEPGEKAIAEALAQDRGVALHPNRVELKMIAALTSEGTRYMIQHQRGDDAPREATEDLTGTELSGRLFDALDALLRALTESGL